MRHFIWALPLAILSLQSCAEREPAPSAGGPHATIQLRDGSTLAGTVVASSPRQIVLAGDDKATRTLDMKQVKAVQYDEPLAEVEHRPDTGMAQALENKPKPAEKPATAAPPPPPAAVEPDAVHERHAHAEETQIHTRTYEVRAGTRIAIRTEELIDSGKAVEGQTFAAEVARDVLDSNGDIVIPRGANARVVIRSASRGGRFKGSADLVLDLQDVSIGGRRYQLDTVDLAQKGREGVGANKRTAEFSGGGAAIGAIIGAIAGGGKGAAIGAASGAGAGVVGQVLTKGGSIKIPVESLLTFELERTLKVVASR